MSGRAVGIVLEREPPSSDMEPAQRGGMHDDAARDRHDVDDIVVVGVISAAAGQQLAPTAWARLQVAAVVVEAVALDAAVAAAAATADGSAGLAEPGEAFAPDDERIHGARGGLEHVLSAVFTVGHRLPFVRSQRGAPVRDIAQPAPEETDGARRV